MNNAQKFEKLATIISVIICTGVGGYSDYPFNLGCFCVALGLVLRHFISFLGARLHLTALVVAALLTAPVQAQNYPGPYRDAPSYAGEPYDYAASVEIMLPDPNPQVAKVPLIPAAICVGVFVGIMGWLGVRILNAGIKNAEFIVTNNAAQPAIIINTPFPDELPPDITQIYSVNPLSVFPGVPGSTNGLPAVSTAPSDCASTFEGSTMLPGESTLPLLLEHSFEATGPWVSIARGVKMGQTVTMPDTGFWRLRPVALRLEMTGAGVILHAPPGILEQSSDLQSWATVADNHVDVELPAEAGKFYRVRVP